MPRPKRPTPAQSAAGLLLGLSALLAGASSCFDGAFIVGRTCIDSSECGPTLECIGGVCGDVDGPDGVPAEVRWSVTFDNGEARDDVGLAIAPDGERNVFIAGYTDHSNGTDDALMLKLDQAGVELWSQSPFTNASEDRLLGVTSAPDDGFTVVGYHEVMAQRNVFLQGWGKFNGQSFSTNDIDLEGSSGAAVAAVEGGYVVVGSSEQGSRGQDVLLTFYNGVGVRDWETFHDEARLDDDGYAVAIGPDGAIAVAGAVTTESGGRDIWLGTFEANGSDQWAVTHDEKGLIDEAYGVAFDSKGALVVVGAVEVSGEGRNIWIRKYSSVGEPEWTVTHKTSGDVDDVANAVTVDSEDYAIVAGYVGAGNGEDANFWVRKLDGERGDAVWTDTFDRDGGDDKAHAVTVDDRDIVYAAGSTQDPSGQLDVLVRSYEAFREGA